MPVIAQDPGVAYASLSNLALSAPPILLTALELVIVAASAVLVWLFLSRVVISLSIRTGVSKAVANSVRQWMGVLVIAGGVATIAYLTGISSEFTTLTITGLAGLTVSLALQTTISNVISGVLLLSDGIIRLGDDIQYGGPGGVRGEVVKLSLRTTWIRTPAGVITVIGNSNLSSGPILNYSANVRLGKKLEG